MIAELLGLSLEEATQLLDQSNKNYKVVEYTSKKPYTNADSMRVVRARQEADGEFELIVCSFKTDV